jgi:hypothetical protein
VGIATETVVFFAIAFFIFGLVFVLLGLSSERGYWSQRDPSGDARKAATSFHTIYHRAFAIAAGEYRAPMRIAAIGVVLWYFGLASLAIAGIMAVA